MTSPELREQIARIIDPDAYQCIGPVGWEGLARLESQADAQLRAERKANAILTRAPSTEGDYAGLDLWGTRFYFCPDNCAPRIQCIGAAVVIKVNGPSVDVVRPDDHGARVSYSVSKTIRTDFASPTISLSPTAKIPRSGQRYRPVDPGAIDAGKPVASTPLPERSNPPTSPTNLPSSKAHLILRFLIQISELLFSTVKGMPNGSLNDGGPGENTGSVGHGAPAI